MFRVDVADGYAVDSLNAHEMSELQRGPLGSTVALSIVPLRSPGDPQTVFLERRPLPQPPLKQVSTGDMDCSFNRSYTLSPFGYTATCSTHYSCRVTCFM